MNYAVALLSRHTAVYSYLSAISGLYIFIVTYRVTFSRHLVIIIRVTSSPLISSRTCYLLCLLSCGEYSRSLECKRYLTVTDNLVYYLSAVCLNPPIQQNISLFAALHRNLASDQDAESNIGACLLRVVPSPAIRQTETQAG
jgi:hypothetical protein